LDGLEDIVMPVYKVEVDDENQPFKPDVSTAISLKRIADALEKLLQPPIVVELTEEEKHDFQASHIMFNKS
jgi:hypothetical protein